MYAPLDEHEDVCGHRFSLLQHTHHNVHLMVMHVRAHALDGKFSEFFNSRLFFNLCQVSSNSSNYGFYRSHVNKKKTFIKTTSHNVVSSCNKCCFFFPSSLPTHPLLPKHKHSGTVSIASVAWAYRGVAWVDGCAASAPARPARPGQTAAWPAQTGRVRHGWRTASTARQGARRSQQRAVPSRAPLGRNRSFPPNAEFAISPCIG